MPAHRYWMIGEMTSVGSGGYVAGAECYIRQTVGGSNEVPIASTSSAPYSDPASVLYDGNPATWWASNSNPIFVAFDYGSPINFAEMMWQARPDEHSQGLLTANIYYSDTSLSGPWLPAGSVTFASWTADGEVQVVALTPIPPGISVSDQSGYAAMQGPNGFNVSEQSGYVSMKGPNGFNVSEQAAYVVLIYGAPPPADNRRQVMINSI